MHNALTVIQVIVAGAMFYCMITFYSDSVNANSFSKSAIIGMLYIATSFLAYWRGMNAMKDITPEKK